MAQLKPTKIRVKVKIDIKPHLCPKCGGNKTIYKDPLPWERETITTSPIHTCDVCYGQGVLWPPRKLINKIEPAWE